jgi:integrase
MSLTTIDPSKNNIASFTEALAVRDQIIWDRMDFVTIGEALENWLSGMLNKLTAKNYRAGMNMLISIGLINPNITLRAFALVNHTENLKKIKQLKTYNSNYLSEATKQARCAAYISFTRHLHEKLDGNFRRAAPSREGTSKTFKKVRKHVKTEAMSREQWTSFLNDLHKINFRDCLIAKLTLQGAKRINEVLTLTVDRIDIAKCEISFEQSKTKGTEDETVITYPKSIIDDLVKYIGSRNGLVFVTRTGKKILTAQVANTFAAAGVKSGIPFKVTPHVLRASCVTYLKQKDFSDTDIMKVTGHASAAMVNAYDKSSRSNNASKKINLVG